MINLISSAMICREFIRMISAERFSGRPETPGDSWDQLHVDIPMIKAELGMSLDWYSLHVLLPPIQLLVQKCDPEEVFVADHLRLPEGVSAGSESYNGIAVRWTRAGLSVGDFLRLDFRIFK